MIAAAQVITGRVARIGRVVQKIHSAYFKAINVDKMAIEADKGVLIFFDHFKAVARASPLQYLK